MESYASNFPISVIITTYSPDLYNVFAKVLVRSDRQFSIPAFSFPHVQSKGGTVGTQSTQQVSVTSVSDDSVEQFRRQYYHAPLPCSGASHPHQLLLLTRVACAWKPLLIAIASFCSSLMAVRRIKTSTAVLVNGY